MDNLKFLVKQRYGTIHDFATNVMEMKYHTFRYNMVNKSFTYLQIKKILAALNIKFEDLQEFAVVKTESENRFKTEQRLDGAVTMAPAPATLPAATPPPPPKHPTPKPKPPLPAQAKKTPANIEPEPSVLTGERLPGETLSEFLRRTQMSGEEEATDPPMFMAGNPMNPKY